MQYHRLIVAVIVLLSACSDSDAPDTEVAAEPPARPAVEPESDIGAVAPQTVSHSVTEFVYRCSDGLEFTVSYGDQLAHVSLDDQSHQLRQQPAASGNHYSDETLELHSKGSDAVLLNGKSSSECVLVEEQHQRLPGPDLTTPQVDK